MRRRHRRSTTEEESQEGKGKEKQSLDGTSISTAATVTTEKSRRLSRRNKCRVRPLTL